MNKDRWARVAALVGLSLPTAVLAQQPPAATETTTLAEASELVTETATDSAGALMISARVVDKATGATLGSAEVNGQSDDMYGLFVALAGKLMEGVAADPDAQARALFALGQLFEAQGHKDLAADAYQTVLETHPDMKEARDAWDRLVGHWELNAYVGLFNDEPEFQASAADDAFRRDAIFGLRGAYHFPFRLFVQGEVANSLVQYSASGLHQNLSAFPVIGTVGYNFIRSHDFHLFAAAGAGAVFWKADETGNETNFDLNLGLGGRLFLTRNHVIRGDVRAHRISSALSGTNDVLNFAGDSTLWGLELSAGVSWFPSGG